MPDRLLSFPKLLAKKWSWVMLTVMIAGGSPAELLGEGQHGPPQAPNQLVYHAPSSVYSRRQVVNLW
jgi:hypothetical protein